MYCDGCAVGNTSLALLSPAGAAAGPDAVGAPPLLNLSLERELLFRFFSDFFLKMGIIASQCWDFGWGTWADDFFVDYCLSRSRVAWLPSSRLSSLHLLGGVARPPSFWVSDASCLLPVLKISIADRTYVTAATCRIQVNPSYLARGQLIRADAWLGRELKQCQAHKQDVGQSVSIASREMKGKSRKAVSVVMHCFGLTKKACAIYT